MRGEGREFRSRKSSPVDDRPWCKWFWVPLVIRSLQRPGAPTRRLSEGSRLVRGGSRYKIRRGNMLVGAVETISVRTTLALQILPSPKPDTAVRHPTVGIKVCGSKPTRVGARTDPVASQKILDGDVEPCCLMSASTLGDPCFISTRDIWSRITIRTPQQSEQYHGVPQCRQVSPEPASAFVIPPQPPKIFKSAGECGKFLSWPSVNRPVEAEKIPLLYNSNNQNQRAARNPGR